jgi:cytidylate kinase
LYLKTGLTHSGKFPRAAGAEIDSTDLTAEQVVEQILDLVRKKGLWPW